MIATKLLSPQARFAASVIFGCGSFCDLESALAAGRLWCKRCAQLHLTRPACHPITWELIRIQEVISTLRPNVIVASVVAHGGARYSMPALASSWTTLSSLIALIQGNLVGPRTVDQVRAWMIREFDCIVQNVLRGTSAARIIHVGARIETSCWVESSHDCFRSS